MVACDISYEEPPFFDRICVVVWVHHVCHVVKIWYHWTNARAGANPFYTQEPHLRMEGTEER